jgi:hypothetical protein
VSNPGPGIRFPGNAHGARVGSGQHARPHSAPHAVEACRARSLLVPNVSPRDLVCGRAARRTHTSLWARDVVTSAALCGAFGLPSNSSTLLVTSRSRPRPPSTLCGATLCGAALYGAPLPVSTVCAAFRSLYRPAGAGRCTVIPAAAGGQPRRCPSPVTRTCLLVCAAKASDSDLPTSMRCKGE